MKVLILCHDFPPFVSVAALRPYSWYKSFTDFGFFPVVITRQFKIEYNNALDYVNEGNSNEIEIEESDKGIIIRTPYKPNLSNRLLLKYGPLRLVLIRKLITAWFEFFQWFFLVGPKKELYKAADVYLAENKVDVIIATGEPFVLFRYAANLSKKYKVPWVADYRDPWSCYLKEKNILLYNGFRLIEQKYLKNVLVISTVSNFFKQLVNETISDKTIEVIANGYDLESARQANSFCQSTNQFVLGFAGTIYPWHPYESFFGVLNEYVNNRPDAKILVRFYGVNIEDYLKELILRKWPGLINRVVFYKKMSNVLLLKELAQCNALLLFNDYSIIGTKIFDYLALRRKIVLCYSNDENALKLKAKHFPVNDLKTVSVNEQAELIQITNSGLVVEREGLLMQVLDGLYAEFCSVGSILCNSINVDYYSRRHQANKYVNTIKKHLEGAQELSLD